MTESSGMVAVMAIFIFFAFLAVVCGMVISGAIPTQMPEPACINMNGHEIKPNPELCKEACTVKQSWDHMQAHYDEVCRCCNARGINYADAGEYQPKVCVVNPDGSCGEDRTCAYYPDAKGCNESKTLIPSKP